MSYSPNASLVTGMFCSRSQAPIHAYARRWVWKASLFGWPIKTSSLSRSARSQVYVYGGINLLNLFVTPPIEPRRVELDGILSLGWGHNFKEEAANRDLGAS